MRQGQQNHNNKNRMRGRNRKGGGPNPLTRSYESNGGDVKIRGTALHVAEKYVQLARDAQASGDRVASENYLQHAEHYYRIVAAAQAQMPQQQQPSYRPDDEGDEDDGDFRPDNRFQPNPQPQYGGGGGNYGQQNPNQQGGGQQPGQNYGGNRPHGQGGQHGGGQQSYANDSQVNGNVVVNGNGNGSAHAQEDAFEARAETTEQQSQESRGDQPRGDRPNFRGRRRRPYRENAERGEGRAEGDGAPAPARVAETAVED